jgi:hypothetical protein
MPCTGTALSLPSPQSSFSIKFAAAVCNISTFNSRAEREININLLRTLGSLNAIMSVHKQFLKFEKKMNANI